MRTKPTLCRPITVSAVSHYRSHSANRFTGPAPKGNATHATQGRFQPRRPSLCTRSRVRWLHHRIYRYIISYIFLICKSFFEYFRSNLRKVLIKLLQKFARVEGAKPSSPPQRRNTLYAVLICEANNLRSKYFFFCSSLLKKNGNDFLTKNPNGCVL